MCPFCVYGVSCKDTVDKNTILCEKISRNYGIEFYLSKASFCEKIHIENLSDMCAFIPDTDKPMSSDSLHHLKVN